MRDDGPGHDAPGPSAVSTELRRTNAVTRLHDLRRELTRFMMIYQFGIDEMLTRINILNEEFSMVHDYNPIEHVDSRLKTPESLIKKAQRLGLPMTVQDFRANLFDIAGIRVTCSFVSDAYTLRDMITSQRDLTVLNVKDYIESPKPNGYRSLHLIVEVPVYLSHGVENVAVEIQLRTVAMDFWASLEHKIYFKYDQQVPSAMLDELKEAADTAAHLDAKMERLHDEIKSMPHDDGRTGEAASTDALLGESGLAAALAQGMGDSTVGGAAFDGAAFDGWSGGGVSDGVSDGPEDTGQRPTG